MTFPWQCFAIMSNCFFSHNPVNERFIQLESPVPGLFNRQTALLYLTRGELKTVRVVFIVLQLRFKYRQMNDGRASAVEEMSSALDAAERSCPGFVDSFVGQLVDGMLSSSLQWDAVEGAIQKTKRSENDSLS